MNLKSDFKLEVENCREELGLSNQNLSPKINIYSLSRVVEMILQHLMIKNLYTSNSENLTIDAQEAPLSHSGAYGMGAMSPSGVVAKERRAAF